MSSPSSNQLQKPLNPRGGEHARHRSGLEAFAPSPLLRVLDQIGHFAAYLTEFMGTFFLVITIGVANVTGAPAPSGPLAIGSVLMACVFMGGHISGAHYNPAVTFGVYLTGRGKISLKQSIGYVIAQLTASLIAGLTYWHVLENTFTLHPSDKITNGEAVSCEFLYTFLLVSVVLNVATTKAQADNSFYGLAIGFTVLAGAITVGPLSGGAFNPAVGFGPIIVDIWNNNTRPPAWIYWLGPFLGSLVAAIGFRVTNHHKEYASDMTSLWEEEASVLIPNESAV
jgi:aquaporin Z